MKNDDNKIEEINDNEEDKNNPPKFYFPIGALIAIGVIIISQTDKLNAVL